MRKDKSSLGVRVLVICFAFFSIMCFLLFGHSDVIVTGNHSLVYLYGKVTRFYSECNHLTGSYAANYLPSTFLLFAIWNIPMRLLGILPRLVNDTPLLETYWFKLFPCILYVICGILLYKLCKCRLNFSEEKSTFICLAFLTSPLAFFSQFIFCQYDVFTVIFMIIALFYYFDDKKKVNPYLFSFFFGFATTFKYQALLFFAVLLVLKYKKVRDILVYSVVAISPAILEILFYSVFDRDSFIKAVFQFKVLKYANTSETSIGGLPTNMLVVFICVLIAYAYFTESENFNELILNTFHFSSGVCVACFTLMAWHPQWILIGVPFWVVGSSINKKGEVFFLLDIAQALCLYCYVTTVWVGTLDQTMLKNGILRLYFDEDTFLNGKTMMEIFCMNDERKVIMYSLFVAIVLINFVFKSKKYQLKDMDVKVCSYNLLLMRFTLGILAFVFPAFICLL